VLIYVHKERELAEVERLYPAKQYVMIDDKLRILNAVKKAWGERVTTIFLKQGHYARDPQILAGLSAGRHSILNGSGSTKAEPFKFPFSRIAVRILVRKVS
jgi:hypothetical protein